MSQEEIQLLKQTITEKETQIADLEKKARLAEFKAKKQTNEFTLNIDSERLKVKNAMEQIERLNTQIQEQEAKIIEKDQKIIEILDSERLKVKNAMEEIQHLNTQIQEQEAKIIEKDKKINELSEQNANIKVRKQSSSDDEQEEQKHIIAKFMPRASMIQKFSNISEIPSYQELIQLVQTYEGNSQEIQAEIKRVQDGTDEVIQQRDTQIYSLQEEIRQLLTHNHELEIKYQELKSETKSNEDKNYDLITNLKQTIESQKQQLQDQHDDFLGKLKDLSEKNNESQLADQIHAHEARYQQLMNMQQEQYQRRESDLLEQLQLVEEKLAETERDKIKQEGELKYLLKQKTDELSKELQNKTLSIAQIQQQCAEDINKCKDEQYAKMQEYKNEQQLKMQKLQTDYKDLQTLQESDSKKIKRLEIEKKRKDDQIIELKEFIKSLEEQLQLLKDKSSEMVDQYEARLQEQIQINRNQTYEISTQQQENSQRISVSSANPNSFEVEFLKAQIDQLKSKGDIELQTEINRLNERERQLKKEIIDLQNDLGTSRLNLTLATKKFQQEQEDCIAEMEHAKSEQQYAEQIAANISIKHATLAMEYENLVLSNRNLRKEFTRLKQC